MSDRLITSKPITPAWQALRDYGKPEGEIADLLEREYRNHEQKPE
jgi:hypothetical protein